MAELGRPEELDKNQSQKYCAYCGVKMYAGYLCPECHRAS